MPPPFSPGDVLGQTVLVYRYTVTGSDKASIDTGVDAAQAGSNDWTNGDLLEVWLTARTDEASASSVVNITVNNDGASHYEYQYVRGSGSTASAATATAQSQWVALVSGGTDTAGAAGLLSLTIPNYGGTTFDKLGVLGEMVVSSVQSARTWAVSWLQTSAINRIAFAPATGGKKFKVGTQLLIYKRLSL